jgi:hypothetical protein
MLPPKVAVVVATEVAVGVLTVGATKVVNVPTEL